MIKYKVILISPPGSVSSRIYTLNELGYIWAMLESNDSDVEFLDCQHVVNNADIIEKYRHIQDLRLIVCIILQWDYLCFSEWLKQIAITLKSLPMVANITVAGRSATLHYKYLLENYHEIDNVIFGESEISFIELCRAITHNTSVSNISGIVTRDGDEFAFQRRDLRGQVLDDLPFPKRDYLNTREFPIVPISSSRDCYGRCSFCAGRKFRMANICDRFRSRSALNIINEIEYLIREYNARYYYFIDDNFFIDGINGIKRAHEFAEEIIRRNIKIKFEIECRVNDIERDLFLKLKKAGLRKILLGIESGSQEVLDRYNKDITVQQSRDAIALLRELSINMDYGFIMFDRDNTLQNIRDNMAFIQELGIINKISKVGLFNELSEYADFGGHAKIDVSYKDSRVKMLRIISTYYLLNILSKLNADHTSDNVIELTLQNERYIIAKDKLARLYENIAQVSYNIIAEIIERLSQNEECIEGTYTTYIELLEARFIHYNHEYLQKMEESVL